MGITQTEFARKYDLPASVVHNASYRIPYDVRQYYGGTYPEAELFKATEEELQNSINYHQAKVSKSKERLLNMRMQKELGNEHNQRKGSRH